LEQRGLEPLILLLAHATDGTSADQAEVYWIGYFQQRGYSLTNHEGGGRTQHTVAEETREKLAATQRGRRHTPEARARMAAAKQGTTPWNKGRTGMLTGEANPAKRPEVRAKISAALMGRPSAVIGDANPMRRPEIRAKIAAQMTGETNPAKRPEVRAKMAAAARARSRSAS
jgi:hypothetical protein